MGQLLSRAAPLDEEEDPLLHDNQRGLSRGSRCSGEDDGRNARQEETNDGRWPDRFLKGVAISVWQNSSDAASNWTAFTVRRNYFGQQHLVQAFQQSCDFWNRYEEDIALTAAVGATSFRFSFEWSRFQPDGPGQPLDPAAVKRYHAVLDCLAAYGLEPMATLHHFTHPAWFDGMGGWEREANIGPFLEYTRAVFAEFGPRIRLWGTFNEPTCAAFVGYVVGAWSPGKRLRFGLAGRVLFNMLRAHTAAYRAIKAMPGGGAALVGMVHQHIAFDSASSLPHVKWVQWWMTHWFANRQVLDFFRTGTFTWRAPLRGVVITERVAYAPETLDWWGINYYSRPCFDALLRFVPPPSSSRDEPLTDMGFPVYARGLYDSIRDASALRVPMVITETGLADGEDRLRAHLIKEYYGEVVRAISDGYDVRGVYWWTLMDNIEWHLGFSAKFGLYAWCPTTHGQGGRNAAQPLVLRVGSRQLKFMYEAWPDGLTQMRAFACGDGAAGV